jgi:hypothetical protein
LQLLVSSSLPIKVMRLFKPDMASSWMKGIVFRLTNHLQLIISNSLLIKVTQMLNTIMASYSPMVMVF